MNAGPGFDQNSESFPQSRGVGILAQLELTLDMQGKQRAELCQQLNDATA